MCQNPNPNAKSNNEKRQERELKKQALVQDISLKLSNGDPLARIQAARDVRKLARASVKTRSAFAVSAVVDPLVSMLSSVDHQAKESALLALLNLAVRNERNKEVIAKSGAISHLVELLDSENDNLRELATASILTLSASTSNRPTIIASGATPLLVQILISGSIQSRVDAVTALYNLSNCEDTSSFNLSIEATRPLLALLKDCKKYSKFAEKATVLLEIICGSKEGVLSISEADKGILTLVETIEEGSLLSKEHAVSILLSLCMSCREKYREIILEEGPIPGLLLLTVDGSKNAQYKSRKLLDLLREECSQTKRVVSEDSGTIVCSIATRVDGREKPEKTARRLVRDMVRRNMELSMMRIQNRATSGTRSTQLS